MKEFVRQLISEFADKEYAHAYMQSHTLSRIAAQIYALRQQRGWSQQELAKKASVSQERVCKLERGDFESLTLKTLWKFSEAFDTDLHIEFSSFSSGILDVANLVPDKLQIPAREADLGDMEGKLIRAVHRGEWQFVDEDCKFMNESAHVQASIRVFDNPWEVVPDGLRDVA